MDTQPEKPMWQLLLEEPSTLTREECYAVIEYYYDTLGDDHDTLFPVIKKYLKDCPGGVLKEHLALYRMMARREQHMHSSSLSNVDDPLQKVRGAEYQIAKAQAGDLSTD